LHGVLRVLMDPLLGDMPLVGALSFFFLKKPDRELNQDPVAFFSNHSDEEEEEEEEEGVVVVMVVGSEASREESPSWGGKYELGASSSSSQERLSGLQDDRERNL
ncbi:hypothetical protein CRUP_028141, partial [Coryphaenoides rupestris]